MFPFSSSSEKHENGLKWSCMASHRVGETGLSDSGPSNHHIPYSLFHGISAPSTSFMYVGQSSSLFHQNLNYLPNGFPSFFQFFLFV
jgi:hypothetical protein